MNAKVIRDVLVSNVIYCEDIYNINASVANVKQNENDKRIKPEKSEDKTVK